MKRVYTAALTIALVAGCKPAADDSGARSLDNFAKADGAKERPNQCGYEITSKRYAKMVPSAKVKIGRIKGGSADLKLAAASALTSVPAPIQTFFYGSGGRIVLSENVAADCKKATLSRGEKEFAGEASGGPVACWRKNGKGVDIVLAANKDVIRHNTVRLFAYLYTQYFMERFALAKLPQSVETKVKNGLSRFAKQRTTLASAFLADLSRQKSPALPRLLRMEGTDPKAFENFVFAEAIDSYFCSKATRKIFEDRFPETYAVFAGSKNNVAQDFGKAWYE